jgi:peptide deformylase
MLSITDQVAILTVGNPEHKKFLGTKTRDFPFEEFSKSDLQKLIVAMRRIMKRALGVGLSANQIGLPYRLFVAEVAGKGEKPKFYAIFNPVIEKTGKEHAPLEEGCLSVPELYGNVERFSQVTLTGLDKNQKPLRIRAWGVLAHVFQHETDHLNGTLFIDRTTDVYKPKKSE